MSVYRDKNAKLREQIELLPKEWQYVMARLCDGAKRVTLFGFSFTEAGTKRWDWYAFVKGIKTRDVMWCPAIKKALRADAVLEGNCTQVTFFMMEDLNATEQRVMADQLKTQQEPGLKIRKEQREKERKLARLHMEQQIETSVRMALLKREEELKR